MKLQLLIILFILSGFQPIYSQTQTFEEDFEDGDFSNDPVWEGDTDDFIITDINDNQLLQLNAEGSGTSYLNVPSNSAYGSWSFFIRFDYTTLSGSNNLAVFLISNSTDLTGSIDGYALTAGETGSNDKFKIVRYDNGKKAKTVLTGTTNINSGGDYQVEVQRNSKGQWKLFVGNGYNSTPVQEATGIDNLHTASSYFGFMPKYTSTRSDKFFFDAVSVKAAPIEIISCEIINNKTIKVFFTSSIDPASVNTSDFIINNNVGSPAETDIENNSVIITYDKPIPGGDYLLTVNNISDNTGNLLPPNSSLSFFLFDTPSNGDVVINEFMYDPPTGVEEYVELKNSSGKYINLQNWQIGDDSNLNSITTESLIFEPDSHIVISRDTSSLSNMFGSRRYIEATVPFLNNSKDAIRILDDKGILVDSLFFTTGWGGDEVALERRSEGTSAEFRENWSDSPDPLGGTPGEENKVEPDNTAPEVSGFSTVSSRSIQLAFDERVTANTAELSSNYSIEGKTVTTVQLTAPDTVEINLSSDLENAVDYKVNIQNVSDIFGNTINKADTSFSYYKISPVDPDDIVINEFMYDPPENRTEYIEIYNYSDKSLDLNGWTLSDNRDVSNSITSNQFILPPEGYVILAPDNTLLQKFPDIALIAMGSYFPALNNGGDQIVVKDREGTILDSLEYTSVWGGEETALERRRTDISATFIGNWENSPGTPGFKNAVQKDNEAPQFQTLEISNASTLQLHFSEQLSDHSATNINNYSVSPEKSIRMVTLNVDTVTLYLTNELDSGRNYRVTVTGLEDLFGNKINSQFQEIDYLEVNPPVARDLVINEILYKRSTDGGPEFIELYNISDKNFILDGWLIGDAAGATTIKENIRLPAGEYLVLTDDQTFADNDPKRYHIPNFPSLNDSGDILYIRSDTGLTVDSLHYKSSWGKNLSGVSLERKDPVSASNDASNWVTSNNPSGYTPGGRNESFEKDNQPPEVIFSKYLPNGNIEVHFNEFIVLRDDVEFLQGSNRLDIFEFNASDGDRIILSSKKEKNKDTNTAVSVHNVSDFRGNVAGSSRIAVSLPVQPGDLVINEIMYSPLSDNEDNLPDQSEYIEIRNITDHAISLEGIRLHDAPDEQNNLRTLMPVNTNSRWISAQDIALVYADQSSGFKNSKIADFFDLDIEKINPLRVDNTTLSLASTGDAIYIADSTGTTIDSVYFDESWQNPNLVDTRGISLERINPHGPGSESTNWGSSIHEKGGTPGTENSLYQTPDNSTVNFGLSFSPNPFSPDDDGYEDNLFINYTLDAADYLIRVRIYDRYGRLVRKLTDGKPAGFEGSIIWDGRRDDGSRNRIGIYIVVFEAFDSSTGQNHAFKETVVLARRL